MHFCMDSGSEEFLELDLDRFWIALGTLLGEAPKAPRGPERLQKLRGPVPMYLVLMDAVASVHSGPEAGQGMHIQNKCIQSV